ncbi:hypothetical protein GCM10011348_37550 [Marinobacterium nitratireducens]|uniref:ABC transporter substrate-binding protein n=1 Tax=Marinobacterium nitratireducens TaxID=518897 RepID=A0A917ZN55_9GAMM|nr:ABC transporter substrate binding protein [Marinobacterium nitratireducens]GGO86527.1 hypothetical protein GCM10011348_37550 [Marinobacterium nitratireducens]
MQGLSNTGGDRPARLGRCLLLLLMLFTHPASSDPLVLLSEDSPIYQKVGNAIRSAFGEPLEQLEATKLSPQRDLGDAITVAIGSRACEQQLEHPLPPRSLICAFIPRATFASLTEHFGASELVRQQRLSAIYLDQPLERQIRLARLLVPQARSIGAMFGPVSVAERERFVSAAEAEQLMPVTLTLSASDNPIEQLQPIVRQSDVFLALPDRALFNRSTAKWLLYATLQQQIPVIGFSRTYVEAGALAAVYTSPEQLGQQAGELLLALTRAEPLPPSTFPKYFSVSTNPVVARNLALPLPDQATLERQLAEDEP